MKIKEPKMQSLQQRNNLYNKNAIFTTKMQSLHKNKQSQHLDKTHIMKLKHKTPLSSKNP